MGGICGRVEEEHAEARDDSTSWADGLSPMAVAVAFCTLSPLDLSGPPSRWAFPHGMVRFKRPNYTTKLHHKTTPQNYTTKLRQQKTKEPPVPTRRSS